MDSVKVYAVVMLFEKTTNRTGVHSCWWDRRHADRIAEIHNGINGTYWVEEREGTLSPYEWLQGQVKVRGSSGYITVNRLHK